MTAQERAQKRAENRRFIGASVCLLFAFSAALGFLLEEIHAERYNLPADAILQADSEPEKPRTFCWEERHALCKEFDLDCAAQMLEQDAAVEESLRDLPLTALAERYPLPEWSVSETDRTVTICHNLEGLCERHRKMYHLGANENGQYVAVYYGPSAVGDAAGAFLVTDVPLSRLSAEQRGEVETGGFEYYSQDELIAMLDNLSEL